MKVFAMMMMLAALFLLYRIACPKQPKTKVNGDPPDRDAKAVQNVMGKSRFVLPEQSKPLQTPASSTKIENIEKKPYIFAAGNEISNAVIPPEKLDEVFGEDFNPDDLDIEPDEDIGDDEIDGDEEDEDLRQTTGRDAHLAGGWSIEELAESVHAVENPTDEKAEVLCRIEQTDLFEQMVSGDEGRAARIKAIIDRHVQNMLPVTESKTSETDMDYGDFDIAGFLGT